MNLFSKQYDFLAIGDTVIDAFIKLTDKDRVDIVGSAGHEDYKICIPFADKIPYEEVHVLNAVGNAANAAVSAARLGLKTALVTNLGDDTYGEDCLDNLKSENISTKFVKINKGIKTNYHYVLWYKTERTILIKHEKYPYELPSIGKPKWVYFSSVSNTAFPFHNVVAEYLENNPEIKLAFQPGKNEINLGKEKLARLYARTEVFFCNVEEARAILDMQDAEVLKLSQELSKLGPKIVVISDGPNGAYAYKENTLWQIPIYPDKSAPVERTGAGDAFASTVTCALALGKTLEEALMWGPINSASVVQYVGAQEGLLKKDQMEIELKNLPEGYKLTKI